MISSSDILHGKILIVDDQEANILLLERMLRSAGYDSIESTSNPNEVGKLHLKNRYDLILLDLEMPGIDGFQVMEGLKEIEPQDFLLELTLKHRFQVTEGLKEIEPGGYLPVIVITAHPDHKLRALQAGARDFISKPFELAEVLARVRNMLEVRLLHVETNIYIRALEQKIQEKAVPTGTGAAPAQAQAPRSRQLRTLLYVEDNPADLKIVEQIIARHPDMRLLTAVDGKSGIEIALASRPDVIMLDINLPDISGFKTLEILRTDPATARIPVIALSANALPLNIESGMEAGFFSYLTKPIKVGEFMAALDMALKQAPSGANHIA